jgi:hypothetical protein
MPVAAGVFMCSAPPACWDGPAVLTIPFLGLLARDADGSLRRIQKGVNLALECDRYAMLCRSMGTLVLSSRAFTRCADPSEVTTERVCGHVLGVDYLFALDQIVRSDPSVAQLLIPYVRPQDVADRCATFDRACQLLGLSHRTFARRRVAFMRRLCELGLGLVDVPTSALPQEPSTLQAMNGATAAQTLPAALDASRAMNWDGATMKEAKRSETLKELLRQAEACLSRGVPTPLAQYADDLLAEALHNLTFDALAKRAPLRVAFEDGSECPPLSIGGFLDPGFTAERWTGVRPLRVSLMSMRHLDQDAFVDMAWFRNADLSRERRAAEIEALAYRTSRDLFGELVSRRGLVVLEVFHTGFKPALIGFYRALGDVLFEQRGRLCVQPMYHRSSRPELGTPWF